MKIKGWGKTDSDPPKELSDDGVSIPCDGLTWYPKPNFYKLNIQLQKFFKKKRGRFSADLITLEDSGKTVKDYVPTPNLKNKLHLCSCTYSGYTRTACSSHT